MSDSGILEIVILAMIAAFLGLRLYSVLGRRAEHEEESIPHRFDPSEPPKPAAVPERKPAEVITPPVDTMPDIIPAVTRRA